MKTKPDSKTKPGLSIDYTPGGELVIFVKVGDKMCRRFVLLVTTFASALAVIVKVLYWR